MRLVARHRPRSSSTRRNRSAVWRGTLDQLAADAVEIHGSGPGRS
jgi:hypothetical protein